MNAMMLLKMTDTENLKFCISPVAVSTSFYITGKDSRALEKNASRLKCLTLLPVEDSDVRFAMKSDLPDKEDAIQKSCADRAGCDLILTRDLKHFQNSPIPVMTPAEFFAIINTQK